MQEANKNDAVCSILIMYYVPEESFLGWLQAFEFPFPFLYADGTRRASSSTLRLGLEFESWGGHSGRRAGSSLGTRAKQTNDVPTLIFLIRALQEINLSLRRLATSK